MATKTATTKTKTTRSGGDEGESIRIAPIDLRRIKVTIIGTAPLITNHFSEEAQEKLETSQGPDKVKGAKAPRNPEAEFLAARYLIVDNGDIDKDISGFPASGIKKALVAAGGRVADAQMTWLRAVLNVEGIEGLVRIDADAPQMRTDRVQQAGRGNLRYRPQYWPWRMDVPIVFNAGHMSASDIVNLMQQAGFSIGIGDWRPEKNGAFGTFEVDAKSKV